MIVYFADRSMEILGQASTGLPNGLTIIEDVKTEEVETGVAIFECKVPFNDSTREKVEQCCEVGNYILRSNNEENEFYTIIEVEIDTKSQYVYMYAEDAGLDLLNEIVGEYSAAEQYDIEHYINKFAYDSGFEIGINEVDTLLRKLSWEDECTAAERLADIASKFDNCEISYSFEIEGLKVTHKYINIFEERGKDNGIQLRLNKEIDGIVTTKSIANVATALQCTGGTPDNANKPITLKGYTYDDGDFYVENGRLYSRDAVEEWSRYVWAEEPGQLTGVAQGHIVKRFEYDTTSQSTLCSKAIAELKKLRKIEVNYEIDIKTLPPNVRIGDRVNIIDDKGELYLSTRILALETSIADQQQKATLGEYLIKGSGISAKVEQLAAEFAKNATSVARIEELAALASADAEDAKGTAKEIGDSLTNYYTKTETDEQIGNNNLTIVETVKEQVTEDLGEDISNAEDAATTAQGTADAVSAEVTNATTEIDNISNQISTLVTDANGETLMTQKEDGTWTFNTTELDSKVDKASEDIQTLNEASSQNSSDISNLKQTITDLGSSIETLESSLISDPNEVIIRDKANIKELQIGSFVWVQRENGNFGLQWKGDDA